MNSEDPEYRYERKLIEQLVRLHQAHFLPLYTPRLVNNLYFDTPQHSYLREHIAGISKRKKVRIRWYGDLDDGEREPQLEIKKKTGWMISKDVYPLEKVTLSELLDPRSRREYLRAANLPDAVAELVATLQPALINRYRRAYWRTIDRRVRLTIDDEMTFYPPQRPPYTKLQQFADRAIVVELKYDAASADRGAAISGIFPFPLEKNSKYVTGLTYLAQC